MRKASSSYARLINCEKNKNRRNKLYRGGGKNGFKDHMLVYNLYLYGSGNNYECKIFKNQVEVVSNYSTADWSYYKHNNIKENHWHGWNGTGLTNRTTEANHRDNFDFILWLFERK